VALSRAATNMRVLGAVADWGKEMRGPATEGGSHQVGRVGA
jgi:hypothetical protein